MPQRYGLGDAAYEEAMAVLTEIRDRIVVDWVVNEVTGHLGVDTRTYDVPIKGIDHAQFCIAEAERRYGGKLFNDDHGMCVVEDANGIRHTDEVLRALSPRTDRG